MCSASWHMKEGEEGAARDKAGGTGCKGEEKWIEEIISR